MRKKLQASWQSLRSLPGWVQIWVSLILVPANVAPFFLLDTWTGQWAALAALFVLVTNGPLMLWYAGMNRALALPHLVAWVPLEMAVILRLRGDAGPEAIASPELMLAWVLLIVNGISLVFDVLDSWRWFKGERETPRPVEEPGARS
jgi:hypothetical protein